MAKKSIYFMTVLILQLAWFCQGQKSDEERLVALAKLYQELMTTTCYSNGIYPCVQGYSPPTSLAQFCKIIRDQKVCIGAALNSDACNATSVKYETFEKLACCSTEIQCSCLLMMAMFVLGKIFLVK